MFDPLIDDLSRQKRNVTNDQFHQWRRNPVTEQFFIDIQVEVLKFLDEALPQSQDSSLALMHQREGAKLISEYMTNWEPTQMEEEDDS